jgi:hypothetical protein
VNPRCRGVFRSENRCRAPFFFQDKQVFFFEKKNQKTFMTLRHRVVVAPQPMVQSHQSFFASFFSKKEVLPSPSPSLNIRKPKNGSSRAGLA